MRNFYDSHLKKPPQSAKKIAIIGGGISGITLAYFFNKFHPEIQMSIFEKTDKLGGHLKPNFLENQIIPMGPKTVVLKENSPLEILLKDLKLFDKILTPDSQAKNRFIIYDQKLLALPKSLIDFFSRPFVSCLTEILKEPFKREKKEDESVKDFFLRRFGKNVVKFMVEPMMKGIYGGGHDHVPISYAFSKLKLMENQLGKILLGMIFQKKIKRTIFSFENGLYALIEEIEKHLKAKIFLNQQVEKVIQNDKTASVITNQNQENFDHVFFALDIDSLLKLMPNFKPYFEHGKFQSITQVYVEIDQKSPYVGFGCLAAQEVTKPLLGILFDSVIFPKNGKTFSCTVMLDGDFDEDMAKSLAKKMIEDYLLINQPFKLASVKRYKNGIYYPGLGYEESKLKLDQMIRKDFSQFSFLDGVFKGVGVADQIDNAYNLVKNFLTNPNF
jgi:oxygen-dependent protoporphyrinogen oxidase